MAKTKRCDVVFVGWAFDAPAPQLSKFVRRVAGAMVRAVGVGARRGLVTVVCPLGVARRHGRVLGNLALVRIGDDKLDVVPLRLPGVQLDSYLRLRDGRVMLVEPKELVKVLVSVSNLD